jgi:hypothetical protein
MSDSGTEGEEKLSAILDEIFESQQLDNFLVTGLYLDTKQLEEVRAALTPDDENADAAGRYDGYPVFRFEVLPEGEPSKVHKGVRFTFLKMRYVN